MNFRKSTLRLAAASLLVAGAIGASAVLAQDKAPADEAPFGAAPVAVKDPTKLLPVPRDYHPKKTSWGERYPRHRLSGFGVLDSLFWVMDTEVAQ